MPGDVITEDNLTYKRPGNGVSPSQYESMLGKKLKVAKGIEEPILFEDLK